MSRLNSQQQGLMPSLLDRLIDPDAAGTAWQYGYGADQIVTAVRRDLEELLNTRQPERDVPQEFVEVHRSVVTFGLPDISTLAAETAQQREEIGRLIEARISLFEPRLRDVRATLLDPATRLDRAVRFRVDARLNVDPAPEIAFDTILELTTGHYSVKPADA
jgi:type VI secretion system protein ImpF